MSARTITRLPLPAETGSVIFRGKRIFFFYAGFVFWVFLFVCFPAVDKN